VESAFKGEKQGLGITKRNKKRFEAQQMLTLLGSLAHNLIVWARGWLLPEQPKLRRYGIVRMVGDVLQVSGALVVDGLGHLVGIILNQAAPMARGLVAALARLLGHCQLNESAHMCSPLQPKYSTDYAILTPLEHPYDSPCTRFPHFRNRSRAKMA
jgi:hypothetical protein